MFRIRRYRIFLVVAILSVISVYHLSRVNHWDGTTLEGLVGYKPDAGKTTIPGTQIPPAQIQPESVPNTPISPDVNPLSAAPVSGPPAAHAPDTISTSSPAPESAPTITGEEFLAIQPTFEEEFGEHGQGRYEVKPRPPGLGKAVWRSQTEHFPIPSESLITLPTGQPQPLPKIQYTFGWETPSKKSTRKRKQTAIREAFKHAWYGYRNHSMGHDELRPLSKKSADPFNGWGATLVDALDTLWIMGLRTEFEEAVSAVSQINFKTSARKDIPLFETTIRYLGGLVAAYDISSGKYPILLEKAIQLAEVLLGAFDTPNRMPIGYYNWAPSYASQPHRAGAHTVMSELGSLAMEFTRLAQITKEQKYYDAIARVTDALEKWQMQTEIPGLWPLRLDASGCKKPEVVRTADSDGLAIPFLSDKPEEDEEASLPGLGESNVVSKRQADDSVELANGPAKEEVKTTLDKPVLVTNDEWEEDYASVDCAPQGLDYEPHSTIHTYGIGAMADSTYEYFPKMFALLGGLNTQYKSMYLDSMDAVRQELLFRPMTKENHDILFTARQTVAPKSTEPSRKKMSIYEGTHLGCFAGGMFALGAKMFGMSGDMSIAEKLTDGCVWAYGSTPIGVMPEDFELVPCDSLVSCTWNETKWHNALDPYRGERIRAVEEYNLHQQRLHEEAMAGSDGVADQDAAEIVSDPSMRKRDVSPDVDEDEPTKTFTTDEVEKESTPPPPYVPRVPLSHEKYVAARILEERLPQGYIKIRQSDYRLRPEAIESVFIMYRITGDESWREKGWGMFDAVDKATKTDVAHAAVKDVTSQLGEQQDTMESFWLAETLKYYYLLFSEPDLVSLDDYVLNTEAHPFKLPK
ncbi:hypothetical protein H2202_004964 [Exophiala xenobiotica]|nr:hypothetical protein H2202_004964 [Exophiala xenobiotica]KAK5205747.1 hypothetical protein LTR41_008428 [Exophiala xenobiotica]KAK5216952.1 hypothetical protein LTR72_009947 [Exophiala xenobiotica]KAK5287614.1 hypothetical protein LTR14_008844 [Exophiala xenobiotica]KAK5314846.1 hypothetical protein LTR93_010229 [Exophiala xenobiotica]